MLKAGEGLQIMYDLGHRALGYLSPLAAENQWVRYFDKWGEGVSEITSLEMMSLNLIHIKF